MVESLGPLILPSEPGTVRLQPVLCDACHVRWVAVVLGDSQRAENACSLQSAWAVVDSNSNHYTLCWQDGWCS